MTQKIVDEVLMTVGECPTGLVDMQNEPSQYPVNGKAASPVLLTSESIALSRDNSGNELESVYLALGLSASEGRSILLCDPLTGLVAYPSFEEHLVRNLPSLARDTLHLAIGDVDDLRTYVTSRRCDDPMMFGHLAGNSCMRTIGAAVRRWSCDLIGWPVLICGTFGGDEVVVAGSGLLYSDFRKGIGMLADEIRTCAPRPCSFAYGTFGPSAITADDADGVYRGFVSKIDRALFDHKAECKSFGRTLAGDLIDVGLVDFGISPSEKMEG